MAVFRIVASLEYASAGSPGVNVWHWRQPDVPISPYEGVQGAVDRLGEFYEAIAQIYDASTTITVGREDPYDINSTTVGTPVTPAVVVGTGTSGEEAALLCIVASWRTQVRGPRGRGRTFLGPLSQVVVDGDGTPNNAYTADIRTAAEDLIDWSLTDGNGAFAIYSRTDDVSRDITGVSVSDSRFAALRSRQD